MSEDGVVLVEMDLEEVHELSVDLLTELQDAGASHGLGIAALALSLGRLMSPEVPMKEEDEAKFVTYILEHIGMYFADGQVN